VESEHTYKEENKMINYNEIFDVSDSYQVPNKLMEILFDKETARQNKIFFIDGSRNFQEGKNQNVLR
jgi:hypothetical protein